jgi:hypothetical protein
MHTNLDEIASELCHALERVALAQKDALSRAEEAGELVVRAKAYLKTGFCKNRDPRPRSSRSRGSARAWHIQFPG